ncbi:MAG: metallopeptidase family protein [Terriglobia bacterium]
MFSLQWRPIAAHSKMNRIRFTQLVEEALTQLPKLFRSKLENVSIIVEDYPEEELQDEFDGLLLGLFRGTPRTEQSIFSTHMPGQIFLYQKNIEQISRSEQEIVRQINKTLKHEIGHYFGLSERQLRRKGY